MVGFFKQIFTWWNSQTLGTRFWTWRKGEFVGEDTSGNRYYRAPSALPDSIREHRWVVYNAIPPGWHGWMHFRTDTPPDKVNYKPRDWQLPHEANLTGTAEAYRPPGSIVGAGRPQPVPADYQPWIPQ